MRGTDSEADSKPFILALDDDFDVVNVFRLGLEKYNLKVFGFTDPLLALEHFKINSSNYEIVVSDIRMPTMNGYEFVKKVKDIKPEIKIFLMTAFEINDIEFSRALPSIRIDEFIQKPVSVSNLAATIQKYINEVKIS
jgi:response regulator RpfG family c-di-GMP phosphodiesterase